MNKTTVPIPNYQFSRKLFSWDSALMLLSLDRIRPYWESLNLNFKEPESVLENIRIYRLAKQQLDEPDANDEDDINYIPKAFRLIETLMETIQATEGESGVQCLTSWLEQDYTACDQAEPWLNNWQTLLFRLARSQAPGLLEHHMSPDKHFQLIQLAESWTQQYEEIVQQIEQIEAQPLEGWDAQQYRFYRRETPDISPMTPWSLYLECHYFKQIWQQITQLLTIEEVEMLNHWGQVEALVNTSIPASMVEIPLKYRQHE